MVNFTQFNKDFFPRAGFEWFNTKGVKDVAKGIIAEVTIVTRGYHDHYQGYQVKILNRTGSISSHYFPFSALEVEGEKGKLEIIGYCCPKDIARWYIARPTKASVRGMAKQILSYIDKYTKI